MSSNNWVVHGDHTVTGMPILASDPHLQNNLPSSWLLYSLELEGGKTLNGGQLPGVPWIGIGRSNDIVWAFSTARCDTSDLWLENLDEDETHYEVDGEWRKLEVITETIKVKGSEDIVL